MRGRPLILASSVAGPRIREAWRIFRVGELYLEGMAMAILSDDYQCPWCLKHLCVRGRLHDDGTEWRCLSCGNCFSCDNCYGVCPDNAVIKLGGRDEPYAFDYDYCKGCGICAVECPCGAIEMVPEEI